MTPSPPPDEVIDPPEVLADVAPEVLADVELAEAPELDVEVDPVEVLELGRASIPAWLFS